MVTARVTVVEADSRNPVSNATVFLAGSVTNTGGDGVATLNIPSGEHSLSVEHRDYRPAGDTVDVPQGGGDVATVELVPQ